MNKKVLNDYLVVTMKAVDMTSMVMRAGCGNKLHLLGWTWEVVSTEWEGKDDTLTKSMTLRRIDEPRGISPMEAIHTNCYPVRVSLEDAAKKGEQP